MKYIDSGLREAEQTVGFWMKAAAESKIKEIRCQAGYFSLDGASLLLPLLKKCASDGAKVTLLLGSNGGATLACHIAFLAGALGVPKENVSLGVVSFDNGLFHPKVYHFVREDGSQTAYVGSANLTEPGIAGRNIEAGVILDSESGDDINVLKDIEKRIEAWFDGTSVGLSQITKHADIDELLANGNLALAPKPRVRELEEEGEEASAKPSRLSANLKSIFKLPVIQQIKAEEAARPAVAEPKILAPLTAPERRRFVRNTESSYHYPQGTHLGHILTILLHFSSDRTGTAFDDNFIRLDGSLGTGRVAAYRRQVKYKVLAAIELGLISDNRLVEETEAYVPALTSSGQRLWEAIEPFVAPADLILQVGADGDYSTKMPKQPAFYNRLILDANSTSKELRELYLSIFLNMPAIRQMLQLLYTQEQTAAVAKARIYENFFEFGPVQQFCDEMGIETVTLESARHRCPFLLNILESCGVITQSAAMVQVRTLALDAQMMMPKEMEPGLAETLFLKIESEWGKATTLTAPDQKLVQALFGNDFLTDKYYLKNLVKIPVKNVE